MKIAVKATAFSSILAIITGCSSTTNSERGVWDNNSGLEKTLSAMLEDVKISQGRGAEPRGEEEKGGEKRNSQSHAFSARLNVISVLEGDASGKIAEDVKSSEGLYSEKQKTKTLISGQIQRIQPLRQDLLSKIEKDRRLNDGVFALPIIGTAVGAGIAVLNSAPASTIGGWGAAGGALSYGQSYYNLPERVQANFIALRAYGCISSMSIPLLAAELEGLITGKRELDWAVSDGQSVVGLSGMADKTRRALESALTDAQIIQKGLNTELDVFASLPAVIANQIDSIDVYVESKRNRGDVNYDTALTVIQAARDKTIASSVAKKGAGASKETPSSGDPKSEPEKIIEKVDSMAPVLNKLKELGGASAKTIELINILLYGASAENPKHEYAAVAAAANLRTKAQQARLSIPVPSITSTHEALIKCTAFIVSE